LQAIGAAANSSLKQGAIALKCHPIYGHSNRDFARAIRPWPNRETGKQLENRTATTRCNEIVAQKAWHMNARMTSISMKLGAK
jgi:hypothetical protein